MLILIASKIEFRKLSKFKKSFFIITDEIYLKGRCSSSIRKELWKYVIENNIKATIIYSINSEQKFEILSSKEKILDHEGLYFINRKII